MTKPVDRKGLADILKKYSCPHPPCPVLLVEDDAPTRRMMRSMLERAGWSVSEAENSSAALERIAENRPALILLDLSPDRDGGDFTRQLRQHEEWRSIPVVVLTPADLAPEDLECLKGSAHTVLDKVGRPRDELMRQVRDLLADWALPVSAAARP
jgi:CheY-like chemotaxis protein